MVKKIRKKVKIFQTQMVINMEHIIKMLSLTSHQTGNQAQ
jgi:hypothetical protein